MSRKKAFLDEYSWKETIPQSPFNDWKEFGAMYVWMNHDKNASQKRIYDPAKDIRKINRILYQVIKTVIFGAKIKGVDGINKASLRIFVKNRFDFENHKEKAMSLLIDWLPLEVKQGINLIFSDYFQHLRHVICRDDKDLLRKELDGKTLTGEYAGEELSSLSGISLSNAIVIDPVNNTSLTHLDSNSAIESIEGSDSIIVKNEGTVWTNNSVITENLKDIFHNEGEVTENLGLIKKNKRGGTVNHNAESGIIEVNLGIVETNSGAVQDNPEGKILNSTGKITLNSGSLEKNNGTVTLNINIIDENNQRVDNNKGIVGINKGHIAENSNTVRSNVDQGVIEVNTFGKVELNRAIIRINESEVVVNENTIDLNGGRVRENHKFIKINEGMIENNVGQIETNSNRVDVNGGTVLNNDRRIDCNRGTVEKNNTVVITNDTSGVIVEGHEDSVVINNKGRVQGMGKIIFHNGATPGSNVEKFAGKILDSDPTSADIFDLL